MRVCLVSMQSPHFSWCRETWWGERTSNGSEKHGSATAPSVPLMITWLHCDVTRLDGEALQKKSFSLTLMKQLLERDLLQTRQNWPFKWKHFMSTCRQRKCRPLSTVIDSLLMHYAKNELSFVGFRISNIIALFFVLSETLTSTCALVKNVCM